MQVYKLCLHISLQNKLAGLRASQAPIRLRVSLSLAFMILLFTTVSSSKVIAYDVCSDDGKCTHEIMTKEGLALYYSQFASNPYAQEIKENWNWIKIGVGNPDQYDPVYGNEGLEFLPSELEAVPIISPIRKGLGYPLVTITHFWDPDRSLGAPMELNLLIRDDYPNAFQAASALWTRALGEYAAGNKQKAYQYLGMVAHFLGDQTIPTHAHNDTHGPDILDDDAFEEWMSEGKSSPRAKLSDLELSELQSLGILDNPQHEIDSQLLWLFLNTNQVADYFASDDFDGDSNQPSDPRVQDWTTEALDHVKAACATEDNGCPTTKERLADNDNRCLTLIDEIDGSCNNNDDDGDLSLIRKHSYLPGIRAMGALFALWEEAIRKPILTVTVHEIKEIGDDTIFGTLGMDDYGDPDFYVGMVMGNNTRTCEGGVCPNPAGAYLEDRNGNLRLINEELVPSNTTRRDGFKLNESQKIVMPNNHFGQAYSFLDSEYTPEMDVVDIALTVWDRDSTQLNFVLPPYEQDETGDINPSGGRPLRLRVDLAKCLSSDADGVEVVDVSYYPCAQSTDGTDFRITTSGSSGNSEDVQIVFSVTMRNPEIIEPLPQQATECTWPMLDSNSTEDETEMIWVLQYLLLAKGDLFTSEPTGVYDSATAAAVARLSLDGSEVADSAVWKKLITNEDESYINVTTDDNGDIVKAVQHLLNKVHGMNIGSYGIDGDFGPATETAVEKFRLHSGLSESDIVDGETWNALSCTRCWSLRTANSQDELPETFALQYLLRHFGVEFGDVDGKYGPRTSSAVAEFQLNSGLVADGDVGPQTWPWLTPDVQASPDAPIDVVNALQHLLSEKFDADVEVSGTWESGDNTERAVIAIQEAAGLEANGIVNQVTWSAILCDDRAPSVCLPTYSQETAAKGYSTSLAALQYLLRQYSIDGHSDTPIEAIPVTGRYDDATIAAVRAMQVEQTGESNTDTWNALFVKLKSGEDDNVEAVHALQTLLKEKFSLNLAVDGIFGPVTEQRVKEFQQSYAGIAKPTGIVDKLTWSKLVQDSAGENCSSPSQEPKVEILIRGSNKDPLNPMTEHEITFEASIESGYTIDKVIWTVKPNNRMPKNKQGNPYTFTPSRSAPHGEKMVEAIVHFTDNNAVLFRKSTLTKTKDFKLFFPKYTLNKRTISNCWINTRKMQVPNWLHYWVEEGAVTVPELSQGKLMYNPTLPPDTYAVAKSCLDQDDKITDHLIFVSPKTAGYVDKRFILPKISGQCQVEASFPNMVGIDKFADIILHENQHPQAVYAWATPMVSESDSNPNGSCDELNGPWKGCRNTDENKQVTYMSGGRRVVANANELLPDEYENIFGTSPELPDSCNLEAVLSFPEYALNGDEELLARKVGLTAKANPKKDWANPGRQSSPQICGNFSGWPIHNRYENEKGPNIIAIKYLFSHMLDVDIGVTDLTYRPKNDLFYDRNLAPESQDVIALGKEEIFLYNLGVNNRYKVKLDTVWQEVWLKLITTLHQGDESSAVKAVQYLLKHKHNFDIEVNGKFDQVTTTAVKQFQTQSRLSDHGIVEPYTWAALVCDPTKGVTQQNVQATSDFANDVINSRSSNIAIDSPTDESDEIIVESIADYASLTGNYTDSQDDAELRRQALNLQVEAEIKVPGEYYAVLWLHDSNGEEIGWARSSSTSESILDVGTQYINVPFGGNLLNTNNANGSYLISYVELWWAGGIHSELVDSAENAYVTSPYNATDFRPPAATFAGIQGENGVDIEVDGVVDERLDFLSIDVNVEVHEEGKYAILGWLYDGEDIPITDGFARAEFTESGIQTLYFDGESIQWHGVNGPYVVKDLEIRDMNEETVIYIEEEYTTNAYTVDQFVHSDEGDILIDTLLAETINEDGDEFAELLRAKVDINIMEPGFYEVAAFINSAEGTVTEIDIPFYFEDAGIQTVELDFDGSDFHEMGINGPYTIEGLSLMHDSGPMIDRVMSAGTIDGYEFSDFVPPLLMMGEEFIEFIEGEGDSLNLDISIQAVEEGELVVQGLLVDLDGNEIGWFDKIYDIEAGESQTITLSYDAASIAANGVDGPFVLSELVIYHTADPQDNIVLFDVFETLPYAHDSLGLPQPELPQVATPEPTTTTDPNETPEPTATIDPNVTPEPTATIDPNETSEPTATMDPNVTPEPTATIDPNKTPEPTATTDPNVTAEPTATTDPNVTAEPTATTDPNVTAEPTATTDPNETAVPTATTDPNVTPTSTPTPLATPLPGTANVSGTAWLDVNANGKEEGAEIQKAAGIIVKLYESGNDNPTVTTTDSNGNYVFANIRPGTYFLAFDLDEKYMFVPPKEGNGTDSDVDPTNGQTALFDLLEATGQAIYNIGVVFPTGLDENDQPADTINQFLPLILQ